MMYETTLKPLLQLTRFNKPIGSLLLLWPTLWSLWFASHGHPNPKIVIIFVLGVLGMRSAGCVINDLADRKFDGHVARTRHRPLVTQAVSIKSAVSLFVLLCLVCLGLVLQLNSFTVKLSLIGLLLAVIYPYTKRFTHFPQLVLGIAFAWSIPMAFAAELNAIPAVCWLIFAIAVLWTFAYDSLYALVDREDDLKIGVKSTAILFGRYDLLIIFFTYTLVLVGLLVLGSLTQLGKWYFVAWVMAGVVVGYQYWLACKHEYYQAFYSNHWLGLIMFSGIAASYL